VKITQSAIAGWFRSAMKKPTSFAIGGQPVSRA
jgi:hypothetical protein